MKMYRGLIGDIKWGFEHDYSAMVTYSRTDKEITSMCYITGWCANEKITEDICNILIYPQHITKSILEEIVNHRIESNELFGCFNG